ncbi:major facilitator superfamily transporter [Phlyctema vagabunda]|uniref:Major facilitator superfamily transporter n=1 Tax=Phlyctema vagabunda TaxID=108571 RepID=A0ABR4PGY7_9HELO
MEHRRQDDDTIQLTPLPFLEVSHDQRGEIETGNKNTDIIDQSLNATEVEDIPPNGGYGWVCVLCVFLINTHTWGINSAYGVFLAHYLSTNTFPNATPLQYAFIGGLSISQALLVSPFTVVTTRRYSVKTTLTIGLVLFTVALLGASFATQIWHLFLSQGLCFGWGMGFLYIGSAAIVPQWFSTRRSLATGITAAGAGFGGLAYNLATNALISRIGLPWTYRVLALCQLLVNGVSIILVRDRTYAAKPNQAAFDYSLLKKAHFVLLLAWGFCSDLGYVVLLFSLPNYALSVGLSTAEGAIVGALLNLGLGIGRPVVGHFSDTVGRLNMSTAMTGLCGVLCLVVWTVAKSFAVLCFFALTAGMVCGTFWSTVAPVGAEIVGMKNLPSALSITFITMMFPTTFAEPIALKLRRSQGNIYLDAQIFTGVMFIVAAMCSWLVRSWKIADIKREEVDKRRREDARAQPHEDAASAWLTYTYNMFRLSYRTEAIYTVKVEMERLLKQMKRLELPRC